MEINYQSLLDQVNAITRKYKKVNELTGENFNIFRILKLESSEVKTHSAFIAELLKPTGSHGQKDVFLKLFVNAFCFKENLIDTESCRVKVEENIGTISGDKSQGGRIDIVITDIKSQHQIIIENKIYAGDQDQQLKRYYNYSTNADIIYLTLDGKMPSENSKREMVHGIHYKSYSYKYDILNWLEQCRKEVAVFPVVREALTHYINLIKYLTNQTLNQNMQEELTTLIKSNLKASFAIADNLDAACDKISEDFGEIIKSECLALELKCSYGISFKKNYSGIWVWKTEWKHVKIGFQFQASDKELIYGFITQTDPSKFPIPDHIKNSLAVIPSNNTKNNVWWAWYRKIEEPYDNWSKSQAWEAILNGKMKESIMEKIKYLVDITKDLEL